MSVAEDVSPTILPKADFATRRLGHANLYVSDLDQSYAFYNSICGFEGVGFERSLPAGFVSNGNTHHDFGLVQATFEARIGKDGKKQNVDNYFGKPGLNHIGWETENQKKLVESYKRLVDGGIDIKQSVFHGGSWALYFFDPDGTLHEFYADARKDWRSVLKGPEDLGLITSQWDPLSEEAPIEDHNWDPDPEWHHVEGAPIRPLRAARTVFYASNVESILPFYTDLGGMELKFAAADNSYAYLSANAHQGSYDIALLKKDGDQDLGYHHIGCEMPDEASMDDAEKNLKEAGIDIYLKVDDARKRAFFLQDPDKLFIEFFVEREPDYTALAEVPSDKRAFYA